ncbi:hypothetical protein [Rhodoblastus sp.]|uniref:hypothetical protein n=1 Tax=Rhodoblastus sp. TaxID=1962975 RepID=UPI0025D3BABF|nr:hypothetical protein [Rhodoblastus sp.]
MAISFFSLDASSLLKMFKDRIDQQKLEGKITTWEKSTDGVYYTHKAKEWNKLAWVKPNLFNDRLTFNIIKPQNIAVTGLVYAYYHGHLTETFLSHFDQNFAKSESTALPTPQDKCS